MSVVASAPAKAILFGEHFVVYGKPALAVALRKRVYVRSRVIDGDMLEVITPLGVSRHDTKNVSSDKSSVNMYILRTALLTMERLGRYKGLRIEVNSEFPLGMGLGASAASSVSTIASVAYALGEPLQHDEILRLSLEAERFAHKNPSGIDSATCVYGGVVYFDGAARPLDTKVDINLLVINSKMMKDTATMVTRVRSLFEENRAWFMEMASISESITRQGKEALLDGDKVAIGIFMNKNHELLKGIGVSTDVIDALVDRAIMYGAYGAKLTGAGGGGCIIALVDEYTGLLEVFKDNSPFVSGIEYEGLKIMNNL
jgi:mevalonate kinase